LHLRHAQARRHHLRAGAHDAAHGEHPAAARIKALLRFHQFFRARQAIEQSLHLVRRAFLLEKFQNNADRFFGGGAVDPEVVDEPRDQFIHYRSSHAQAGRSS
jgi:hypothetical protein